MTDYIEREAAKLCVKEHYDDAIIIALNKLPSADVAPVRRGRWHRYEQGQPFPCGGRGTFCVLYNDWFRCSECGVGFESATNYCPNCGAKMQGDDNEQVRGR